MNGKDYIWNIFPKNLFYIMLKIIIDEANGTKNRIHWN